MSHRKRTASPAGPSVVTTDLQLLRAMLARLRLGQDLRRAKVRRVRHAIRANDYENPLKLDVAADRLTDEITSKAKQ